jgi:hypothetical protein
MTEFENLGRAKPGSRMLKRGYTINLAPNATNKPLAETKPPAKPEREKKPSVNV